MWRAIIYGITKSRTQLSVHRHESNTIIKQKHFLTTLYTAGIVTDFNHAVQSLSHLRLFVAPWTGAHQASLSFTIF